MNTTTSNTTSPAVGSTTAGTSERVRTVEGVYRSEEFHWVGNGFHVSTYFPSRRLSASRVSPFVLMDYGPPKDFAPLASGKRGVGFHPHRGFETVTLAWEGSVAHRDNAGNAGVIGPGDAQWMTAASGIFHEEFHEEEFTRKGGRMHMMQLWVNLPAKDKMSKPGYQALEGKTFPVVALAGGGNVRVIAGEHQGQRGPARTFTPITMLDITLKAGERLPVTLPASYNALAVVAEGEISAGDRTGRTGEVLLFANDGESLTLTATVDTHVILLSGEPIDEPIVQYGPFVMNTVDEIREAMDDVRRGKMGPIPD